VTNEQDRPEPDLTDEPEATDDTAPLMSQPEPPQPPAYPAYPQPSPYPYGYQRPQYPYAGYPAYAQPQQFAPAPRPQTEELPKARVPGWLWPVVAATALIVGTIGGAIGGTIATDGNNNDSFTSSDNGQIGSAPTVQPPLSKDNGSIAAVAAKLLPSTVQVNANGGAGGGSGGATGSGFVVDTKGHVITNNHVVADATGTGELEVVDFSGRSHAARIIGRSPVYDIAVLEVANSQALQPAALGSSRAMRIGESVVAIGSPLGLSSTVTSGIVSALDRPVTTGSEAGDSSYINAVQTDAAINPGNSGGPLVNLRGEVVGVNSAIATTGGTASGESGNIGVGFAIPMEQVRITANQILRTGEAQYPVIGANVNTVPKKKGANIVKVNANTPAEKAGLEANDLVVAVNGKQVTDSIGLIVAIRAHQPGETIILTLLRGDQRRNLKITLAGQADKP
jgi:putative serine protease PepD